MTGVKLKKLVNRKEAIQIIEEFSVTLGTLVGIQDETGDFIMGEEKREYAGKYPIEGDNEVIGWVLGDRKVSSLALMLSYMASSEYEKKKLAGETLTKYREISLLYEASEKITSCLDLKEVTKLVSEWAMKFIRATNARVMIYDNESGTLQKISATFENKEGESKEEYNEQLVELVMNSGTAEIINDVSLDPRFAENANSMRSIICAPLKVNNKIIGAIELGNTKRTNYIAEDLKLINTLATHAAIAIENAGLYDTLRETFFETVQALAETIEKKDPYTAGHAKRVAKYSAAIGEELGLSKDELTRIKLAALLHDIGKIGIEDSILLKKERLSREEYSIIKKHSEYGSDILQNIKRLNDIVPCVRSHHERFDGLGYPDGIKEEQIPLIARIIAVADSFDAMTSNRSYRFAMDKEIALGELKANINTQFDPQMVAAFLNAYKNKGLEEE